VPACLPPNTLACKACQRQPACQAACLPASLPASLPACQREAASLPARNRLSTSAFLVCYSLPARQRAPARACLLPARQRAPAACCLLPACCLPGSVLPGSVLPACQPASLPTRCLP